MSGQSGRGRHDVAMRRLGALTVVEDFDVLEEAPIGLCRIGRTNPILLLPSRRFARFEGRRYVRSVDCGPEPTRPSTRGKTNPFSEEQLPREFGWSRQGFARISQGGSP